MIICIKYKEIIIYKNKIKNLLKKGEIEAH